MFGVQTALAPSRSLWIMWQTLGKAHNKTAPKITILWGGISIYFIPSWQLYGIGFTDYPGWWFGTFFIFHNIWENHQPLSFSPTFLNPKQLPKELARVKTGSFFSRTKTGIFPSFFPAKDYPLVNSHITMERSIILQLGKSMISMAIFNSFWSFIVDLPVENGDFPQLCQSLPED